MMPRAPYIRILTLIFFVGSSIISGTAQNIKQQIIINTQSATTTDLLEIISRQCQCYFAYPSDLNDDEIKHDIKEYQGPADVFIRTLFKDSIAFASFKNQVILTPAGKKNAKKTLKIPKLHEIITLSGTIVDQKTKRPIPYASISIHGSRLGTISNTDGQFKFKLPIAFQDSTVQISCMGYFTQTLKPFEIEEHHTVYLRVANISLQEVIVRSVGSHYIIEEAKKTLDRNYRKTPYNYQAFYRELALKRDEHVSYHEALFEGYSPKGSISRDDLVLKKGRQFTHNNYRDTIQLKLKGGTDAALKLDIANFKPDFLRTGSEAHYHYHINDLVIWHNELVYVINFTPIVNSEMAIFKGELYISFADFSLLGAHFSYTKPYLKGMKNALIVKKNSKIKVQPETYDYHVEYQKLNGKYHINYVKGDITIKAKKKHQLRYVPFSSIFEMTITGIDTIATHKPRRLKIYHTSSIFSEQIKFSSEEFWQYDNLIVPEEEIMKAFYSSGFSMEEHIPVAEE